MAPIYEYECRKCGERDEVRQGFNDPALQTCRHCKAPKLERLISAPALIFKGEWPGKSIKASRVRE